MVEKAKAGDKCTFTGAFIVVPDVSQLGLPGVNKEMQRENQPGRGDGGVASQGLTGLKALGVRDLQYKTAFLSCHVRSATSKVSSSHSPHSRGNAVGVGYLADTIQPGSTDVRGDAEEAIEDQEQYLNSLTPEEINELRAMVHSDNIYQRLVSSIAPTVYGEFCLFRRGSGSLNLRG